MNSRGKFLKLLSIILTLAIVLSACSKAPQKEKKSYQKKGVLDEDTIEEITLPENIWSEDTLEEDVLNETILNEFITEEIYLEEIVIAEEEITEILLAEDDINSVEMCKSIYVPEENLDTFSEESETGHLFGEDVDISSLLKKITVGTGVIVTLVVLKHVKFSNPIASVVVAAADKSLKFSGTGAAIGSLYGGLTGAADEIDESGRASAVIAFATAVAGLVLSTVSLIAEIPSGGSSSLTLAAGIKLTISAVSVLAALGGTVKTGYDCIKTFNSVDAEDIDWDNIDWEQVGVSAAEQAIENAGDGYMWGSIVGAVYGGADGYEFFKKYHTPYSTYNARLVQTPKNDEYGHWTGKRGESEYIYDKAKTIKISSDKYVTVEAGTKVSYQNCVPDFSPFQEAQVRIHQMTNSRIDNFDQADEILAEHWDRIQYQGKSWNKSDVKSYRRSNNLTWHEMNNMEYMQLVPTEVNSAFGHLGGVGEYNVMVGQDGYGEWG